MNAISNFVWFDNSSIGVNMGSVSDFDVDTIKDVDGKKRKLLRFIIPGRTPSVLIINNKDDIDNFLQNVARV